MKISKHIKILWEYLEKHRSKVYFIAFIALISSVISAVIPYIYGRLVDIAIEKNSKIDLIFGILTLWLILALISNWADRHVSRRSIDIGNKSSHNLLLDLADHVLRLPVSFHKDKRMGEILQRIGRASDYFMEIITETVFTVFPELLRMVVILVIIACVEWRLSLAVFIVLSLYSLVSFLKVKPILKSQKKLNKAYEKSYGALYNSTFNFDVVKSSIAEPFENRKNIRNFGGIFKKYQSLMKLWMNMGAWQQTILRVGFVFVFGLSIFFLRSDVLSPGELVMFVGYTSLVYQPVAHLANNYRRLKRNMIVVERALSLFEVKAEKYKNGIELKNVRGEISFQNVSFHYKQKQSVLKNIDFDVRPGEAIALVGESGVGKTTLVDLISRYYKPTKGKILIDGHDVEKINLSSIRENIAIVPQEVSLFNDTIKNNIAYGKTSISDAKIIKVAKAANAHEFIQKFPKKYNQLVGQRGIKLSTGQKQRVAIARALLRDPKILILDEATSSLDSESEKKVQEALEYLIKGRTTFIIAHRLSTICHADKIIVIEKGEITETGTHDGLMRRKNGRYRKFFMMQSAFGEDVFKDKTG